MFFTGDSLLSVDALIEQFHQATQIVLTLNNQKNAIQDETVFHFKSDSAVEFLFRADVNMYLFLRDHICDPTNPVRNFPTAK